MDSITDLIAALRSVELFSGVPDPVLHSLAEEMRTVRFDKGEVVLEQDTGRGIGRMYVILEGTAQAEVDDRVVATYRPGDHFGEMSVLDGQPRSATVRATSALHVAGLASWNLRAALVQEPSIAIHIIEVLARRLRAANQRP